MGFTKAQCEKALRKTGGSVEAAMEWIFSNPDDDGSEDPAPGSSAVPAVDPASVEQLMQMGFTKAQCEKALRKTGGSVEAAMEWIFSNPDDDGSEDPAPAAPLEQEAGPVFSDGPGDYELIAIISHLGKSTSCGHYVCHIKKDGQWALFNDEKVSKSEKPPFEHGYLYLYARKA